MKHAQRSSIARTNLSNELVSSASPLERRNCSVEESEPFETATEPPPQHEGLEAREPHTRSNAGDFSSNHALTREAYLHQTATLEPNPSIGAVNVSAFNEPVHLPPNLQDYVDAFFDHVAPYQANAFLHQGTMKQQLRDGEVPEHLLLAICAISARFVSLSNSSAPTTTSHNINFQSSQWARIATHRLMASRDINLTNAVVALLLCKNATYDGAFNHAFLLAALANRYALKLRLFDETKWPSTGGESELRWVEKEQRRRIMFACYCVDRMTATGMKELTFVPANIMTLQLPCEDYQYE
jgi:Fungal specific transcription factor domain